jgi:hypothetical protein
MRCTQFHPEPSICHCRMCQKAFGNYFAPLAGVPLADFRWTKGEPGIFRSSELVERGFCRDCGTPLTFRYLSRDRTSVSIGSLDDPGRVKPVRQHGIESPLAGVLRASGFAWPDHGASDASGMAAETRVAATSGPRLARPPCAEPPWSSQAVGANGVLSPATLAPRFSPASAALDRSMGGLSLTIGVVQCATASPCPS